MPEAVVVQARKTPLGRQQIDAGTKSSWSMAASPVVEAADAFCPQVASARCHWLVQIELPSMLIVWLARSLFLSKISSLPADAVGPVTDPRRIAAVGTA